MVKLFVEEIAHVKLHDNFLLQKEIEYYMLIFFSSYFIMFLAAENFSFQTCTEGLDSYVILILLQCKS